MGFQTILVEKKGQIGIITLNRPQKSNPFGTHLAAKLNASLPTGMTEIILEEGLLKKWENRGHPIFII